MKRILIYGINFPPEQIGIGKYTGEMAAWLAGRGDELRVVTAPPYYPEWRVRAGYAGSGFRTEQWQGMKVWRCPVWVPDRPTGAKRILHLLSFALSSAPAVLRQAFWRPDVVWAVAPSLMCAPAAWLAARLSGAKAWLHVQDLEVDTAFELGILRHAWIRVLVLRVERWLLRRFDRVSTISTRMSKKLIAKGVPAARVRVVENWVNLDSVVPINGPSALRSDLGVMADTCVVLYSGNMAEKQGLDIVVEAARLLRERHHITFILCGEGPARAWLERLSAGLPNIRFLALQPVERLNELLNLADIHLLPQRAEVADLVMPSKLTNMLASGRPVVSTAAPGTQVDELVRQCGIVVPPGDVDSFARAIELLAENSSQRKELGRRGREYAESNWGRDEILTRFENELLALCA
jgi:colanic acid biosynthesis glycosyl transferase WcaI